ncbi:hypothetical protein R1sor_025590 [Riccia sorocarpa]|uniref:ZZ-type domain-containing protein n=1 Tax=Riccia sorocarpa TaxID=122646 RepID=A0ABD3GAL9_9MARC
MAYRKFPQMKSSEYRKQNPLSEATAKQLAEYQSPNGGNVGHPWIHTGFNCSGCSTSPITGFLYKYKSRSDYYLCGTCFKKQPSEERQEFLRFERALTTPPYHMHCVECDECGVAPILGPRYRQKTDWNHNLCAACFGRLKVNKLSSHQTESPSAFELLEETTARSGMNMRRTVFHYGVKCDGCKCSPICGPRYSLKLDHEGQTDEDSPAEINLCLVCFDNQYNSGNFKEQDDHRATGRKFRRVLRPEGRSAVHVEILSCRNCNATPICGPAYLHIKGKEALCLSCYMTLKNEKQVSYVRLEAPTQLNPALGNITEEEVKNYLERRKPACWCEEDLLEATMVAQRQLKFRHKLVWNPVKRNLRLQQEIQNWSLKIVHEDGSWSWAYP